ncbi:unnamed protein product [Rotaria sp. Silwood2]|nr:unnamed protein product [Rotaria sp. Silwood2]CAF2730604.1 unnamed protein product [Rotaria sp. Silwood2]CAF3143364.1 unnamed protein product [Rotaria sp. Silwood2]CAF4183211.1 unnamed protein product [Rotaria sp. Silwood2]CAF4319081.1 unnamed protein product [Rotaria sp. Silwood2]
MANNLKKDHLKNLDPQQINGKPMMHMSHDDYDDDQDIYISERSSIASSNDMNQVSSSIVKRLPTPTPTPSSLLSLAQKQPHNLRYHGNELQENGLPTAIQCQLARKEERKKKKTFHKATLDQGTLAPLSEIKSQELTDNYYPYWGYYKLKNPDRITHHRQIVDGQIIPNESLDPSQHVHQPALTTSSIKPKQQPRKSRQNGVSMIRSNQDKQRYDHSEKNSPTSSYLTFHDIHDSNYQQQHVPFENSDHDDYREQPTKHTISQQRRKLKTENDSTDHYVQLRTSKSPQNSNSLIITSNSLTNRSKNRSKIPEKNSLTSDIEENNKHRHSKHYHHHQDHTQSHNSPSIPSQQNHHHHQNLHIRRRPPSGSNHGIDLQIIDTPIKKSERPSYFQQGRESFHLPTTPIFNQNSYLPPIIRDHHHHQKTNTTRFPTEYYGTLARQAHGKDWEEPIEITKIYKSDPQTRFYDRYLNNVVDKRLAA